MTGFHDLDVHNLPFYQANSALDPWLISDGGWRAASTAAVVPPSLFDPDDDEQDWTPPASPPNISAIKKSLIQAQQFLSTASHIDPWTVNQVSPPPEHDHDDHHSKKNKKKVVVVDGIADEEITAQNLYKTELCRSFMETNTCRYGVKCQFAHGRHELRAVMRHPKYKTEICKTFHTLGTCPYGTRCRFIHTRPKDIPGGSSSSSATSSAFSSPAYTPPDSPSISSTSPPEVLQWSTSWALEPRAPIPSPEDEVVPRSPIDDSNELRSRLPIFRNIC